MTIAHNAGRRQFLSRRIVLGLTILAPLHAEVWSAPSAACGNFEPGAMSLSQLQSEFEGAILRLQVAGTTSSGTGYLIDNTQGYILTALHVVNPNGRNSKTIVDVTSPNLPGQKLQATVVDSEAAPTDLALLKLASPGLIATIRPIDVALRTPGPDDILFSMGYPKIGDEPNLQPKDQPVSVLAMLPNGYIEVKQTEALGGASGGPLLNGWGSAIGTCGEQVGVGGFAARYVPMASAQRLLDEIPMSAVIQRLDAKMRAGSIDQTSLQLLLKMNSKNPTNLELYTWVRHIIANAGAYSHAGTLIKCPIIPALIHRKLDDLVVALANTPGSLASSADPKQLGDAYLHVAQRETGDLGLLFGDSNAQRALDAYTKAGDQQGIVTAKLALVQGRQTLFGSAARVLHGESYIDDVLRQIDVLPAEYRPQAYFLAAQIDAEKGNPESAIAKYTTAGDLYGTAKRYVQAAYATEAGASLNLRTGKVADALDGYSSAVTLFDRADDKWGKAGALVALAKAQTAVGQESAAKETLKEVYSVDPTLKTSNKLIWAERICEPGLVLKCNSPDYVD